MKKAGENTGHNPPPQRGEHDESQIVYGIIPTNVGSMS